MLIFLIGCAEDLSNSSDGNSNTFPNFDLESTFSVITWNVELFPKHFHTVNYMAEIIVDLNADVFGLQEITSSHDFNQLITKINDLVFGKSWMNIYVK